MWLVKGSWITMENLKSVQFYKRANFFSAYVQDIYDQILEFFF